jgi:hypothetical protein
MQVTGFFPEILCDTSPCEAKYSEKLPFNPGTRSLVPSLWMDFELPEGIIESMVP